jgi:hypothetical protein
MKDIQWNTIMLREFESLACLSDEEKAVLRDWAYGKSIVHTAMRCHMGETKVKDIRKALREKYDAVQIYTLLLPART